MTILSLCEHINAPVKLLKIECPSSHLSSLGIIINTTNMQVCKYIRRTQAKSVILTIVF